MWFICNIEDAICWVSTSEEAANLVKDQASLKFGEDQGFYVIEGFFKDSLDQSFNLGVLICIN